VLVVTFVELVAHRIVTTAIQPELLEDMTESYRFFATYSPFLYHAASFLAVAAMSWLLLEMARDHLTAPLAWRVVLGLSFCTFIPITAVGSFVASSQEVTPFQSVRLLLPYLNVTFALVVIVTVAVSWTRPMHYRIRFAMILLAIPLLLLTAYRHRVLELTVPKTQPGAFEYIRQVSFLSEYGGLIASLGGYWLFLLVTPPAHRFSRSGRRRGERSEGGSSIKTGLSRAFGERLRAWVTLLANPIALGVGLFVVAVVGTVTKVYFTQAQRIVQYSLGLDLPPPSLQAVLYLVSLLLFVAVEIALVMHGPRSRLLAAGLALFALAGYRLEEPLGYSLSVLGLLAFYRGGVAAKEAEEPTQTESAGPTIVERRWREYLRVLASRLSASDPTSELETAVVETGRMQVSRVFGRWMGTTLDLRFGRRYKRLASAEVTLGEVPSGQPDWAINRRGTAAALLSTPQTTPPAARTRGERSDEPLSGAVEAFRSHFAMIDREDLTDRLLKEPDHLEAVGRIYGRVAVWWGIGLKHWIDPRSLAERDSRRLPRGKKVRFPLPLDELITPSETPPSPGEMPDLLDLLLRWARRASIAPTRPPGTPEPTQPSEAPDSPVTPEHTGSSEAPDSPVTPEHTGSSEAPDSPVTPEHTGSSEAPDSPVTPEHTGSSEAPDSPVTPEHTGSSKEPE
jgi:hypothetical protein